jgi:hypothetical protein
MTHKLSAWILPTLALVCIALTAAAEAPTLTFTFTNVTVPGATEVDSYAINNGGEIAGDYVDSAGVQHGLLLSKKTVVSPTYKGCSTTPGTTGMQFYGINSADTAVGYCESTTTGQDESFTFSHGKFAKVTIKGATQVEATGINDSGTISGTYVDSAGAQHGFILQGTTLTTINAPGVSSTYGWGINNDNIVAVYGTNSAGQYVAFTTKNGKTFTQFAAPQQGSLGTVIHTAANNGAIAGTYYDSADDVHGWLFDKGTYYTLNNPNGCKCDTRADGINNSLTIVGRYSTTLGGASIGYQATTTQ